MRAEEREAVLRAFAVGSLKMLCACDILNEGWDCPDVEVLLMARPTLSKIIYMQQLGRGTRKAPGKESLIVFDFVDNAGRYSQSWSLHHIAKTHSYRPGAYVLSPDDRIAEEQTRGETSPVILSIGIWTERFEEIDIFDWQSEIQRLILDMPFRKFTQRGFLDYGRDVSRVRFAPALWKRLTDQNRQRARDASTHAIGQYFAMGTDQSEHQ